MRNAVLHPLLHSNTSDLIHQNYSSVFTGNEFFFDHHEISGQKNLKASVYMEMARAAAENALPGRQGTTMMELRHMLLGQPFVFGENKKVSIALLAKNNEQTDFEIYSLHNGELVVHCQGQVYTRPLAATPKLDVAKLRQQHAQGAQWLLTDIELPASLQNSQHDFMLHPHIVDRAMRASFSWVQEMNFDGNKQYVLSGLESIGILLACPKEVIAWARLANNSKFGDNVVYLDIDLCDHLGNVCARIIRLACNQEDITEANKVFEQTVLPAKPLEPKQVPVAFKQQGKISIGTPEPQYFRQTETKKLTSISLLAPDEVVSQKIDKATSGIPTISLPDSSLESFSSENKTDVQPSVGLFDYGNGVFSMRIEAEELNNTLSESMIDQLLQALETAQRNHAVKVLILNGTKHAFLNGGRSQYNAAVDKKLFQAISSFPYPVIAAMQGDATGTGFFGGRPLRCNGLR
ncbi:MAG: hypothetical protein HC896_05905 [Bacteroidales bacterium]|nr:hypothetical protein [Bacteroidales bacterium]